MDHGPLDVVQVGVVLQSSLQQAGLLTEAGDVGPVVVGEHLVAHDGVRHLGGGHQVHLQQPGLEGTLGRPVVLQGVQEEGGALLDHVLLHEDVHDLTDVSQGLVVRHQHPGELGPGLGVDPHDAPQEEDVVGGVAHLLGVEDDLLELAGLGEALDHLVGNIGPQVDGEGEGGVGGLDEVAQLLAALQLVLLEPLLQELLPALGQDGPAELQGLVLVELTLVQQDTEILQQWGGLAGLGRDLEILTLIFLSNIINISQIIIVAVILRIQMSVHHN